MPKSNSRVMWLYDKVILARPGWVICMMVALVAVLGYFAKNFQIDASTETLIKENDAELRLTREVYSRYGIQDFLVIAYSPHKDLLSDAVLHEIARLRDQLKQVDQVKSVLTILDVPLLESPPVSIRELAAGKLPTLTSPRVNRRLARKELQNSPLYRNLLVSPDLSTTAIQVNFKVNEEYRKLVDIQDRLQLKETAGHLSEAEAGRLARIRARMEQLNDEYLFERKKDIASIRSILDAYRGNADIFLGGVSMVAVDLIRFVKNDIEVFGIGVLFFLILTLGIIFRRVRWVMLPLLCCVFSVVAMMGLLSYFGWKVTVISSNFISLQLIITMAIAIHLIVRYRELASLQPEAPYRDLIRETMRSKMTPVIYTVLTTIAGFGSLLFSDILPVITFGWMMVAGLVVSFLITFVFFPSALMLMKKRVPKVRSRKRYALTTLTANLTERYGNFIIAVSLAALVMGGIGVSRLRVENSFINYFKKSTEIYKGMKVIDQDLGGTTPMDVLIDFGPERNIVKKAGSGPSSGVFDEFSEFETPSDQEAYWFTPYKMNRILKIHDYLQQQPEIGKVLSLGTLMKMARRLNGGKPLDSFDLSLIYNEIPREDKQLLVEPYVSVPHNQARFFARVVDSNPGVRRNELIQRIYHDLTTRFGLDRSQVHITGMLVLYNNMLQSLFKSQILTLGIVLAALMAMFFILFRSLKIALIAIFPNLLSIGVVLGVMGWLNIPLDMMTITIASISVGIAVDDTIHYIHRFRKEFQKDGNYIAAMHRCHDTIGYAMYYTSVTIIIGFSILVLSNFIPTIVFGLFTGLAMLVALTAALTLLPKLIILIKPFGPEERNAAGRAGVTHEQPGVRV